MPWITGLAVLGLAWSLARRRFFLPAWLIAVVVLDATAAPTDSTIPLALLAAVGVIEVVAPRLASVAGAAADLGGPEFLRSRPARLTLVALLGLTFLGGLFRPIQAGSPDQVLGSDVRASMAWVAANTPAQATFAIVTGRFWFSDQVSEWFPAFADRASVATVQGYEWLGSSRWWRQQDANADLQACSTAADGCLTAWMKTYGVSPMYVYLPKGRIDGPLSADDCCTGLRETLAASPKYTVAYDGPGASIFEWRTP